MLCVDGVCTREVQRPSIQSIRLSWTFLHITDLQLGNLHQIKGEMRVILRHFSGRCYCLSCRKSAETWRVEGACLSIESCNNYPERIWLFLIDFFRFLSFLSSRFHHSPWAKNLCHSILFEIVGRRIQLA